MFMTAASALPGRRYRVLQRVVGGFYPFVGPSPSCFENAYWWALGEIEWQASYMGANAVIDLRVIRSDRWYVLVAGTAIQIIEAPYYTLPQVKDEEHSRWPGNMWDFVWQWTRDL